MSTDYRTLFDGLTVTQKRDRLAHDELSACEREVVAIMREARKRNKGRVTLIVEYIGTAYHVLEALPPKHVKLHP